MQAFGFELTTPVLIGIGVFAGLLLLAIVALLVLRRRTSGETVSHQNLAIDLNSLEAGGPPSDGPIFEFYGTPVRLVVLILAPAGRGTHFPPKEQLREVVDLLIPNLAVILDSHKPIYRRWPEQLSSQGFVQSFFNNLQLPGDRGKGTPWCSVAGRFDTPYGQLLAGLVCRTNAPNGLSQTLIEHEGKWNDTLRVKN